MLRALRRCRPGAIVAAALGPGAGSGPGLGLAWGPRLVPARGRKTRHDPPAKAKAARLKVPPPVDPAELAVVTERYRQHRAVLGALRYRGGVRAGRGFGEAGGGLGRLGGCCGVMVWLWGRCGAGGWVWGCCGVMEGLGGSARGLWGRELFVGLLWDGVGMGRAAVG